MALGRAGLLPPLSSGGALVAQPWLRFHTPSRPGESHPEPLTDPDVSLSPHPARATHEGWRLRQGSRVPPVSR